MQIYMNLAMQSHCVAINGHYCLINDAETTINQTKNMFTYMYMYVCMYTWINNPAAATAVYVVFVWFSYH